MSKKKASKQDKHQRRLTEIAKANSYMPVVKPVHTDKDVPMEEEKYRLPYEQIKTDVLKNIFYTLFAIAVVLALKQFNVTWPF